MYWYLQELQNFTRLPIATLRLMATMSLFYFFTIVFILWELNTLIFTKSYNDFLESSIQRIQTQM